ncbi:thioredoxin domain-containing protein [Sphingomonas mollis]|uniref:Thioredoxin domain-containing protein n=1 Tax=Sphingomonas mollis TaxID=2795726 RepID=A0ABS0XJI8_9SPHN|nr:thioredoxin domain-containing protein [Sphingomonas sp. BT553]MBJ6120201.1 thioredoxin domain-containing protein [Sphingomonas sp. BT553]
MKYALALIAPALSLAACSGSGDGGNTTAAAPVAAVKAPAGQSWTETVTKTSEGYLMGNPNAPIKLVEYGARTCPTCGAFAREGFQPLTNNYVSTGKVSFEFRDYLVHGAPDLVLSLLGTCGSTAAFFPILEQTYANQSAFLDKLQALTPAQQQALQAQSPVQQITSIADAMGAVDFIKQRGIPETQARQCLTSQARIDAIAKPTETATKNGTVTGTPTFIINGNTIANTVTWPQLETALKNAGA